ncbi:MAG: quinolinate synthase NadA [Pseudomonadota bacterium]
MSHDASSGEALQRASEIRELRDRLGDRLLILTHHYQRPELVALGHIRGDSYELSRLAADSRAEWIVFCGVHFMAQSAAVLARDDQRVFHPNPRAGCPMADMAERGDVQRALDVFHRLRPSSRVVPLTYMNTLADVKAVVGENGGAVCTSSNAERAFRWAYGRGEQILFVPDEHLGRNTAASLGLVDDEIALYDPHAGELGGLSEDALARARLVLWSGYCHVHTWFSVEHIAAARQRWPGCVIHVHPECRREVVQQADGAGSTGYLVRAVQEAKPGDTLVIGTEVNLVTRLAAEFPDRTVVPLDRSLCPNMYRITLRHLQETLLQLPELNQVQVNPRDLEGARLALQRMLEL